jgi:hypothetical protein
MRIITTAILAATFSFVAQPAHGQIQAVAVGGTGTFSNPVFAASAPGAPNTLHVVQQGGLIRSLNLSTGTVNPTPLLNLPTVAGANFLNNASETGLLGMAFHPNFQNNGLMYVQYTYANGSPNHGVRVEQYTVSGGAANPASRRTVLEYSHPDNNNHNAGWIGFNPLNGTTGGNSGHLFITTGDGGGSNDPQNNAQNRNSLLGKLLRLDVGNGLSAGNPTPAIPAGNMTGAGTRPELFSYGLRNPYRAGFDRQTGHLYLGDVGQNAREEINFIANGASGGQNFGWRLREGTIATGGAVGGPPPADNVEPIFDYPHTQGRSVTGGYVYRGSALDDNGQPLDGTYFFGDFVFGQIFSLRYDGTTVTNFTNRTTELGWSGNVSSFAEDGFGNLYAISYSGTVFSIVPVPEPACIGLVAAGLLALARYGRSRQGRPGPASRPSGRTSANQPYEANASDESS